MAGLERQRCMNATNRTNRWVGLPPLFIGGITGSATGDCPGRSSVGPAVRTVGWLVREAPACVGSLLASREREFLAALAADQHKIR